MTDADRIAQATPGSTVTRRGIEETLFRGPVERQRCTKHPRCTETYRWVWRVDANTTHEEALENGDAEIVRGCSACAAFDG